MNTDIELTEELQQLDELLDKLFYGTLKSERVMIAVDRKMHTVIMMFAKRRGWTIRQAVGILLTAGFDSILKREIKKVNESDKTIRGISTFKSQNEI